MTHRAMAVSKMIEGFGSPVTKALERVDCGTTTTLTPATVSTTDVPIAARAEKRLSILCEPVEKAILLHAQP